VNGLKKLLGADDALDVFGVHAVGGILGALLTGVFNSPKLGGPSFPVDWFTGKMTTAADYSIMGQLWIQAQAVGVVFVWTAVVAFVSFKIADLLVGLRVTEEEEREGLDINSPRRDGLSHVRQGEARIRACFRKRAPSGARFSCAGSSCENTHLFAGTRQFGSRRTSLAIL